MIRDGHELTRPMLAPPQSYVGNIRHTPHHVEHHRAIMLVERHGHEVWTKILHLQGLHLVEGESNQKYVVITMTNLKHRLNINKHVSHRLHYDDLAVVNELHLLMKGRRNGPGSMDLRSAQK